MSTMDGGNGMIADDQIQALEALYKATNGKSGTFVDLRRAKLSINVSTLLSLVKQGFIRRLGKELFTLTQLGIDRAIENRQAPADE